MEQILITPNELRTLLKECVREELQKFTPASAPPLPEEEYITTNEAIKILQCSKVSLHKWKTEGRIKFLRIGTRIRFKKSEILSALQTPLKYGRKAE